MGISLLSEEDFEANKHYLEFLLTDEPIQNGMQHYGLYRQMLNTRYSPQQNITLLNAKETLIDGQVYPEYSMNVAAANIVYQLFLPVSKKNMEEYVPGNGLRLEVYPTFILDGWGNLTKVETCN